ncbi:MAG: hypothetical protein RL235_849 [Chlamydiota bacterium]|jgi:PleD family two-component response regulator
MMPRTNDPALLVISKNPAIRFWFKSHETSGFVVYAADSVPNALEVIARTPIDLIVLDSSAEELSAARALRAHATKSMARVILITGRLNKTYRKTAAGAGIADFISSQLDIEEVKKQLEIALKAKGVTKRTDALAPRVEPQQTTSRSLQERIVLPPRVLQYLSALKGSVSMFLLQVDTVVEADLELVVNEKVDRHLRSSDLFIALGSRRYLVLLSHRSQLEAEMIARDVQKELASHPFRIRGKEVRIAFSVAVGPAQPGTESGLRAMVQMASKALEQAHGSTSEFIILDAEGS